MSFKVLVIPEDPTFNGYILKPLVEAILAEADKPQAKVTILTNPRIGGFDQAMRSIRDGLPDRYGHWDLWIFMPDADRASEEAMRALEGEMHARGIRLLCCPAQPEVEIYCCAAYRTELGAEWKTVRSSARMKEDYFQPLLGKHGSVQRAGGGRDTLVTRALSKMSALFQICPELKDLRDRIRHTHP